MPYGWKQKLFVAGLIVLSIILLLSQFATSTGLHCLVWEGC